MRKLTIRSLWEHKRRLISTIVAIVLGVAFMTGTFVFADTLDKVFDDLFATANEEVDARVQGEVLFSSGQGEGDQRARFDEGLLATVEGVDGVAAAAPAAFTFGGGPTNRILDGEGDPIGASAGPPTLIETWVESDLVSAYDLTEGSRGPEADDEIALNVAAAEEGEFELGDRITLTSPFGNVEYTLVGTFTFGDADSAAGAVSAEFTLAEAQRLAGAAGQLDSISVAADDGVSQEEITRRITEALAGEAQVEVITGDQAVEQDANSVQEGLSFFRQILTIFGTIALLVGIFIIANTFQILIAQRTRELALLRAVGAGRSQVLRAVLFEALLIGLVAGVLGILAGIALAAGITALLSALGTDLPSGGLVIGPRTVVIGLVIGLVVTMVAAVVPAIKATRVPPLAALRDVAIERPGASRLRIVLGIVVIVLAGINLSQAFGNDGDTDVLPAVGLGALLLISGAIIVGPVLAGPTVRIIGGLLPRFRGITGRLATENAARAPKRTSATASALLIGVALIGFVTVFAQSAKESVASEVNRGLRADLIVQPSGSPFGGAFIGFTPEVARTVSEVDGVGTVASFAAEEAQITYPDDHDATTFVGAVEPRGYGELAEAKMETGSLTDLEPGGVIVDRQVAEDNDLEIGSTVGMAFAGGGQLELEVQAISDDLVLLAFWTIHIDDFAAAVDQQLDFQVFADVTDGDVAEVLERVETALEPFPELEVLDQDGFIGDIADQLTAFVNVIYGLLGLSIIIAMIGVANTLSLSVHERTRELGLLRAVGMARAQVRSAIRWEAVIIAVLGTLVGLTMGMIASYAMITALEGFGLTTFAIPYGTLIVQVVIAAGFGVLASLRTARRAAKLDILAAIAQE